MDLIDTSSGGLWSKQKIEIKPGYQGESTFHFLVVLFVSVVVIADFLCFIRPVHFAEAIKVCVEST